MMRTQAAAYLNITPEQLLLFVGDGELRFVNVGRGKKRPRYRFHKGRFRCVHSFALEAGAGAVSVFRTRKSGQVYRYDFYVKGHRFFGTRRREISSEHNELQRSRSKLTMWRIDTGRLLADIMPVPIPRNATWRAWFSISANSGC
jgi:hypothetical protein